MLKLIVYLFAAAGFLYLLFYPFLKRAANRRRLFKWFIIVYVAVTLASTAGMFLSGGRQPASFREGVQLVKKERTVQDRIGEYKAVKFEKEDLPAETDNPADLKFTLRGSKGALLIESTVAKDSEGGWYLVKIRKDSLLEAY